VPVTVLGHRVDAPLGGRERSTRPGSQRRDGVGQVGLGASEPPCRVGGDSTLRPVDVGLVTREQQPALAGEALGEVTGAHRLHAERGPGGA
jgi:hypothetical protein